MKTEKDWILEIVDKIDKNQELTEEDKMKIAFLLGELAAHLTYDK